MPGYGGQRVAVDPNTPFRSGDSVRLAITPNVDAFLYVGLQGSDGTWEWIRPGWAGDLDFSPRGREVLIPPRNWFEFDSRPGTERLFVYLTPERDDGILDVELGADGSLAAVRPVDQGTVNELTSGIGSMNLVLGKEDAPEAPGAAGQAVYVVNPTGGGAWTLIELLHR